MYGQKVLAVQQIKLEDPDDRDDWIDFWRLVGYCLLRLGQISFGENQFSCLFQLQDGQLGPVQVWR